MRYNVNAVICIKEMSTFDVFYELAPSATIMALLVDIIRESYTKDPKNMYELVFFSVLGIGYSFKLTRSIRNVYRMTFV